MRIPPFLSSCLALAAASSPLSAEALYSWQENYATVTPEGNLRWAPEPFVFRTGASVRYIDHAGGDDTRDGRSRETAWKHHPWDARATGEAAAASGSHTYVFKRGVEYRGTLVARESGTPGDPIRFTADPAWGEGEAVLLGSIAAGGWQRADAANAPGIPDPARVWYVDLADGHHPRALWQVDETGTRRLHLARTPNWQPHIPDDFRREWWSWEEVGTGAPPGSATVVNRTVDRRLRDIGVDLTGATVWSEWIPVMGTPNAAPVEHHDPETGTVYFTGFFDNTSRLEPNARYFLEDLPQFLDAPGEYYFASEGSFAGRLYLRLHDERDPNTTRVEIGRHLNTIDLRGHSHIHIEGLAFRHNDVFDRTVWSQYHPDVHAAAIRSYGPSQGITVRHCLFEHLGHAVFLKAYGDRDLVDDVLIADNVIRHAEQGAINLENGAYYFRLLPNIGDLGNVRVLRNLLEDIGYRPERKHHGHALTVLFPQTAEVAGNFLYRTGGAGIFVFGGKGHRRFGARPFTRILVHQNKAVDTLLLSNDWGGIEIWQGGPIYLYNNISGNPGGYWHWKHLQTLASGERDHTSARFGFPYYLDGMFKSYVFNNVAWGLSSDLESPLLNTAAFQAIHGFFNTYFHNTAFRFAAGMRRQAPIAGREHYLGNLWIDISEMLFRHDRPRDAAEDANVEHVGEARDGYAYETLAYAGNVVFDGPPRFGVFESSGRVHASIGDFANALERRRALAFETGVVAAESPVVDAEAHDFRLRPGSAAIGRGFRVFVPWALSEVVGEWHFHYNRADPARVIDEHWNMTEYHIERDRYHEAPRLDLEIVGTNEDAFVESPLEDWVLGALRFDGERHARVRHATLREDISYVIRGREYQYPAARFPRLDMTDNNFIIELVVRVDPGHTEALLVGKSDGSQGYRLLLDERGHARLELWNRDIPRAARTSSEPINDGNWRHLLVEVERNRVTGDNQPIRIHIDGRETNGDWEGVMPTRYVFFDNEADFLVGGGPGENGLKGAVAFLRISRGSLADARTTIGELHTWQFDGPHLRDFAGNPRGPRRFDAGAFQFTGK